MSAIDQYDYSALGVILCPATYSVVSFGLLATEPTGILIYRLDQDIPRDEYDFRGRDGDLLLGGGGGEAPALHIWMPETLRCFTHDDCDAIQVDERGRADFYHAFWEPTDAYMLCEGFAKCGWKPVHYQIERWLAEHVFAFLIREYSSDYARYLGSEPLTCDGSICRLLTHEEDRIYNWKRYR